MDATTENTKTARIRFADGRRGIQTCHLNEEGQWYLSEIVITQQSDGSRCREVYGPRRYLDARVYSFGDLGNVTWDIEA